MFFSPRKTLEFRAHQATFNEVKVVNWLFICNAILKYAEIYSKELLSGEANITLRDVLDIYKLMVPSSKDAECSVLNYS